MPKRKQPFTYAEFKQIYSQVPKLCVEVVLQDSQGIYLRLRTEKGFGWENQWHLPGGTVYYKEPIAEAVKRVAKDEIGVEVEPEGLIGFIEYPSEEKERGFGWSVGLAILCSTKKKVPLDKEHQFFTSLPQDTITEQRQFLEGFLKGCDDPDCEEHQDS